MLIPAVLMSRVAALQVEFHELCDGPAQPQQPLFSDAPPALC